MSSEDEAIIFSDLLREQPTTLNIFNIANEIVGGNASEADVDEIEMILNLMDEHTDSGIMLMLRDCVSHSIGCTLPSQKPSVYPKS